MKKDIRDKVKRFLTSEVGRTGVRAPLVLGLAGGAVLLSQIVHTPVAEAGVECQSDADCGSGGVCYEWCGEYSNGTCVDVNAVCVNP